MCVCVCDDLNCFNFRFILSRQFWFFFCLLAESLHCQILNVNLTKIKNLVSSCVLLCLIYQWTRLLDLWIMHQGPSTQGIWVYTPSSGQRGDDVCVSLSLLCNNNNKKEQDVFDSVGSCFEIRISRPQQQRQQAAAPTNHGRQWRENGTAGAGTLAHKFSTSSSFVFRVCGAVVVVTVCTAFNSIFWAWWSCAVALETDQILLVWHGQTRKTRAHEKSNILAYNTRQRLLTPPLSLCLYYR